MSGIFKRLRRGSPGPGESAEDIARRAGEARQTAENDARGLESERAARSQAALNEERRQASEAEARRTAAVNETRRLASDAEGARQSAQNEERRRSGEDGRDRGDTDAT